MTRIPFRPLAVALIAATLPSVAHAEPKDDARRHFKSGLESAQEGDYSLALQHFLAAQEAYPHPATTYNIARSYMDLGDLQNALTYYRLYRDQAPEKAADIDPIVAILEQKLNPANAVTGGGVAGTTQTVVVSGPTTEELGRLQAIAAELAALSTAIQTRAEDEIKNGGTADPNGVVDPNGSGVVDPNVPPVPEPVVPEIPTGGFLSDAYERVVTTASRYGQAPLDSPSTISVLTRDDIRNSGATNFPDLFRRVVGLDVMTETAGHGEVSIRGFNRELNNKVLILIDGRSTYWDFLTTTVWQVLPVSLEEIDRIEIIRGPGSAVYGANAVTGVINIITETPGDTPRTQLHVDAGSAGYTRSSMVTSGRVKDTSYRLSAGYEQHNRWSRAAEFDEDSSVEGFSDDQNTARRMIRANGRVDQTFLKKGYVSLSGGFSQGQVEFQNIGVLGDYVLDSTNGYVRTDIAYGPVHALVFWNTGSGLTAPWLQAKHAPYDLTARFDNDVVNAEVETPVEFTTGPVDHKFNFGLGYRYKRIAFDYFPGGVDAPVTEHHFFGFLNEEATIGPVKVVASLRLDRHPLITNLSQTLSPRGSVIGRVAKNTSVRATGGTSFRAPNSVESYMNFNLPASADGAYIRDLGNLNLVPERIITAEVAVHDESTVYHQAELVLYYNRVSNLIGLDSVTPGISFLDPATGGFQAGTTGWINTPEVYNGFGGELDTEFYPVDGLDVFANVNVMAVFETLGDETTRDQSPSLVKANLGASYRTPVRVDVSGWVNYSTAQTWRLREFDAAGQVIQNAKDVPGRTTASLRVAGRPLKSEALEVAATWWNIAGSFAPVREHPSGQPVGSTIYGSLEYKFQ